MFSTEQQLVAPLARRGLVSATVSVKKEKTFMFRPRREGKVFYEPEDLVPNPVVDEARKHQRQLQEEADRRSAERREERYRTMPNRICYADTAFKNWTPDM